MSQEHQGEWERIEHLVNRLKERRDMDVPGLISLALANLVHDTARISSDAKQVACTLLATVYGENRASVDAASALYKVLDDIGYNNNNLYIGIDSLTHGALAKVANAIRSLEDGGGGDGGGGGPPTTPTFSTKRPLPGTGAAPATSLRTSSVTGNGTPPRKAPKAIEHAGAVAGPVVAASKAPKARAHAVTLPWTPPAGTPATSAATATASAIAIQDGKKGKSKVTGMGTGTGQPRAWATPTIAEMRYARGGKRPFEPVNKSVVFLGQDKDGAMRVALVDLVALNSDDSKDFLKLTSINGFLYDKYDEPNCGWQEKVWVTAADGTPFRLKPLKPSLAPMSAVSSAYVVSRAALQAARTVYATSDGSLLVHSAHVAAE